MKEYKEEWLNTESDKYYKGFRYEKFESTGTESTSTEFWYDENGIIRKAIGYHSNDIKEFECYYNEKGELHNEDGYARQLWFKNGDLHAKIYYLNGKYLTEQEWKVKTGKVETIEPDYLNPESDKYYKGYRYEKDKYGNEYWYGLYDGVEVLRKTIHYYNNGNKASECYYNEEGEFHNEDGYAIQKYDADGKILRSYYYLNGKEITEYVWEWKKSKPEYLNPESDKYYKGYRYEKDYYGEETWFDENNVGRKIIGHYENGKKSYETYFNEKSEIHNEEDYAVIEWDENGNIEHQEYWLFDDQVTKTIFNHIKSLNEQIDKLK